MLDEPEAQHGQGLPYLSLSVGAVALSDHEEQEFGRQRLPGQALPNVLPDPKLKKVQNYIK